MKEVTFKELQGFIKTKKSVRIGGSEIELGAPKQIKTLQPENFSPETTTVWSFPKRGEWATHYLKVKACSTKWSALVQP